MRHFQSLLTAILPALFITGVVGAATTLSQNIVTEGDLTVGGNVGIGVSVLSEYFHIQDSEAGVQTKGQVEDTNSTDWAEWRTIAGTVIGRFTAYGEDHATRAGQVWINQNTSNPLIFSTGNAERARIDEDGDFGIGTNNPGSKLDVAGNVNSTGSYLGDGSQLSGVLKSTGENLVSYWKFGGNLLDAGFTQDLSLVAGTETYVEFPFGQALDFDGSTYYHASDADYDFEDTDSFSIAFWGKTSLASGGNERLITKGSVGGQRLEIVYDTNEHVGLFLTDNINFLISRADFGFENGNWFHIVTTYDGSETSAGIKIYVNGVLQTPVGVSNGNPTSVLNGQNFSIGAESAGGNKFTGQLSHVRVYNSELTAEQVETLFQER